MKTLSQFIKESQMTEIDKALKELESFNDKQQRGTVSVGQALIAGLFNLFKKEGEEVDKTPSMNEMKKGMWLAYNPNKDHAIVFQLKENREMTYITWSVHVERNESIINGQIYYDAKELDEQLINNMDGEVKFIQIKNI